MIIEKNSNNIVRHIIGLLLLQMIVKMRWFVLYAIHIMIINSTSKLSIEIKSEKMYKQF